MTRQELLYGNGRIKPDILTYSEYILTQDSDSGCQATSGTSISAAVMTGSLALMIDYFKQQDIPYTPALLMKII